MTRAIETYEIEWQGIAIEINWEAKWHNSDIYPIAHIQLRAEGRQPLPMTETGYRSHFVQREQVEAYGTPVEYVTAWLEEAALSPAWPRYVEESKQMSLF
ncbi:hypothetical protein [Acidimangrovimonas pyrenivorans]|uniref:Uncharacterized protein n=1 Tax=Acidimangrovimonas pyrenivorans TaxID=2030798 RepID=A0ABV7AC20_9RHOB